MIRVQFDGALSPSQLRLSVADPGGVFFGPRVRPETAGAPLGSEQTMRVLLPDARAGEIITVRVDGLVGANAVGSGTGTATVIRGREVIATVVLTGPAVDAGGCDASSCPEGCCSQGVCQPRTLLTCGARASTCVMCDAAKSGECGATGFCQCGAGVQCGTGQRCVSGSCVCDATSCPGGCCLGQTCNAMSLSTCGAVGGACASCNIDRSDSCENGGCGCGPGAACGGGQRCVGGLCVCDATSCPTGCCQGNSCSPRALVSCGAQGDSCVTCDSGKANVCSSTGQCRCGLNPACATGQSCSGGGICTGGACDATTCPNGCCKGAVCTAASLANCGSGGSACSSCNPATSDACAAGGNCQCGSTPSCASGQRCVSGACVCDALSCPTGCCAGLVCTGQSLGTCGAPGLACQTCNPSTASSCTGGTCGCGTGRACGPGTRCVSDACVCDATSCATGCCSGGACNYSPSVAMCGLGGSTCSACDSNTADTCASGSCKCGGGNPCPIGEMCGSGGNCTPITCNVTTCPNGCCSGTCKTPSFAECGANGGSCTSCNSNRADNCSSEGHCRCGMYPSCAGPNCVGGTCSGGSCNSTNCPNGCCLSGACTTPSLNDCGHGGSGCVTCSPTRSDQCAADGVCRCGTAIQCSPGKTCAAGACT